MPYITKFDGKTDTTIQLGNKDKSTNNPNSVEGYFLGTRETPDTGYGPGKLHLFQTEAGTVGVWGKTNSNRLLTASHRGQMCLLEFTGMGERKKGKNPAYEYSFKYDPNNTIDVSAVDLGASEPESDEDDVQSEPTTPVASKVSTAVMSENQKRVQDLFKSRRQ